MNKKQKLEQERQEALARLHSCYGDYHQDESSTSRFMADNGHPYAADYETLYALFDSLKYACNSRARLISYKDAHERAEYWAPALGITWRPTDFAPFYDVYPAMGAQWSAYMQAAADRGWPVANVEPSIDCGTLLVTTLNSKLAGALLSASMGNMDIRQEWWNLEKEWHLSIRAKSVKQVQDCFKAIERYHKPWVLPKRTPGDDVSDHLSLPLEQKKFRLANVQCVMETDRAILVPLIPITSGTNPTLINAANDLLELCARGYPYHGAVRKWLSTFYKDMREFDRHFAKQNAGVSS